jgi:hypothetical protein
MTTEEAAVGSDPTPTDRTPLQSFTQYVLWELGFPALASYRALRSTTEEATDTPRTRMEDE